MRDFAAEIAAATTSDVLTAIRLAMVAHYGKGNTPMHLQSAWSERKKAIDLPVTAIARVETPALAITAPDLIVESTRPDWLAFDQYRRLRAMNFSTLKHGAKSMLHLRHAIDNPDERDTISRMVLRCIHAVTLEPDRFPLDFAIWTGGDRRGGDWKEFQAANSDKTIVKQAEYESALAIRDALARHPEASQILRDAKTEHSITWEDEKTGVLCKGRLDVLSPLPCIADLKGTGELDDWKFASQVERLLYYAQGAWYQWGNKAKTGDELPVLLVTYETAAPYDVVVWDLDESWIDLGRQLNRRLLDDYAKCMESGIWPGRSSGRRTLNEPPGRLFDTNEPDGPITY